MMLLGGIHMLNDYEIQKLSNDKYGKIISILKLIAASLAILCTFILLPSWIEELQQLRTNEDHETLKVRVIANSNTTKDQQLKQEIVKDLSPLFLQLKSSELESLNESEIVQQTNQFLTQKYGHVDLSINIGEHLTPPKWQNGLFYPQAFYNTLVVKIGEGRGDNFWCSVFPNVCEGPSKNDEQDTEQEDDEEVKFIIWEWIKQLFS